MKRLKESSFVSLIAVFAAFTIVCDSLMGPLLNISGVWYSWIFIAEPISGIILGPYASFFSTFIGVMVGHSIYIRGSAEFLFTLGAPIGAVISSLIFRGKWKIALIYYSALLGAFFITPVSWELPFWGMWDVYLAFGCLLVSVVILKRRKDLWNTKSTGVRLLYVIALSAFIGLEADVLFRIFILVPCQTYQLIYALDVSGLQSWWAIGAVETSTKAALSTLISMIVAPPAIKAARQMGSVLLEN
ncbi:hypothetical protein E3J49_00785 [Candidatus Bathyarchaeota archaeon]|nr:hypothetical protein [Candidatus Bathyarchaeota archaeon]TET65767.1 MAG: hypothetical protein E3J49_00785 [Candidatus Bathyarchaeota archaeon]